MTQRLHNTRGFTLIEIVIVILVIGIVATVVMREMDDTIQSAQYEQTKREMEQIVRAMVGNPAMRAEGTRLDFGYVGDVGALPPNLDALVTNPRFATWDGPYLRADFESAGYKRDAWGTDYTYTDTLLRSIGSGSPIDKVIAPSTASLTANRVTGFIADANRQVPRGAYRDSVVVSIDHPNGAGGTTTSSTNPVDDGSFTLTGIPIGNYTLQVVFTPESDTASYPITVLPGRDVTVDIVFPSDLW